MKITEIKSKTFELEDEYIVYKLGEVIQIRAPPVAAPKEALESTPGAAKESTNFDPSNQKPEGDGSERAELPKGLQPRKINFEEEK